MSAARAEGYDGNESESIDLLSKAYRLLPTLSEQLPPVYASEVSFRLGVAYMRLGETQNPFSTPKM